VSGRGSCIEFITLPRSLPVCGAAECDREALIMWKRWSTRGCCTLGGGDNRLWKAQRGSNAIALHSFFNLGARWGGWSTPPTCRSTPGKENQYPCYSRLSGPWGPSGRVRKTLPLQGLEPRTVQPINAICFMPLLSASASRHSS
jgi:hypothetical protein